MQHTTNYRIIRFAAMALLLGWLISSPAVAQKASAPQTMAVMGSSSVVKDKVDWARERAIASSLVSALERATASQLPMDSMIQNFHRINESILSKPDDFIEGYKVLTESRVANIYRVIVQATVSTQRLKQQLAAMGIMVGSKPMPRLLVIMTEQNKVDSMPSTGWNRTSAEAAMLASLTSNGFTLIDPANYENNAEFSKISATPVIDAMEAIQLGTAHKADVVVIGSAIADYAPNTMGGDIKSFNAEITLQAFRTESGEEITTITQNAVSAHADEAEGVRIALDHSGRMVGEALSNRILETWGAEKPPAEIRITVEGTRNLANFVLFRRTLSQIPGVNELQTREMKADEASLVVDFDGSEKDLADALLLKTFDAFGINISEVSSGFLRIELIPG